MNCMLLPPPEPRSARLLVPTLSVPDTKPEMYGVVHRGNHVWSGLATAGWIRVHPSHATNVSCVPTRNGFPPDITEKLIMFNS
jgi:hypothetical protein